MPRPSTPRRDAPDGSGAPGTGQEPIAARVAGLTGAEPVKPAPSLPFLGCAYVFGLVAGVVLGIYGVAAVPAGPRVGGTLLSFGLLVAIVGNTGISILVRWLTGTRLGAMVVLVGWAPVVLMLGSSRHEGDLMLRASATGYAFLALGALAPIIVAVVGQARRGLTALSVQPPASRP